MADARGPSGVAESATASLPSTVQDGYYIIRSSFERHPGVPASGILLLAMSQVANWQHFAVYRADHYLRGSTVSRKTVSVGQHDVSSVLSSYNNLEYLMFKGGVRVVVPQESIDVLDALLKRTKPLYDEHAMAYTADDKARPWVLRRENFGTWADQVLDLLERVSYVKGFFWRSLEEVNRELVVANIPLPLGEGRDPLDVRAGDQQPE